MPQLRSRLNKLEKRVAEVVPRDCDWRPRTAGDWLYCYEYFGRDGLFDGEPDFPIALDAFRRDVESGATDVGASTAWRWLGEMFDRVNQGKPPIRECEFHELAGWLRENESTMEGTLDLDGRRVFLSYLQRDVAKGPRAEGVTQLVEDLREIRSRLG